MNNGLVDFDVISSFVGLRIVSLKSLFLEIDSRMCDIFAELVMRENEDIFVSVLLGFLNLNREDWISVSCNKKNYCVFNQGFFEAKSDNVL